MSVAVLDRLLIRLRWWALRSCSGRRSGPINRIRRGTPTSTTRPRDTDVLSRIADTSRKDTMAPLNRAVTSMSWPRCERSEVPIATTSPVDTFRDRAPPRCTECRPTSCTVR